ncbi:T9SS type B sorting domain-containing protein [Formosa sp. PL04]|uniref:T9SS type B sorting domain-containing protein n=1 Tax=Formosa sp. PL04 TaxID=3081755 RepID=UPI002980AD61|nr:T9SS type B sorting domain-containing protein [Formosa sp. PL04]MDW5289073.1 T9SS type B sorting domain-containing protein [Formosa sp. PL04]
MKTLTNRIKIISCVLLFLYSTTILAQFQFCSGNSGIPIFSEDFGSGTDNISLQLPAETTYTFASIEPNDGFYTISSNTNWYGWHNTQDHTAGDTNGRSLIVNAAYTAGEFFRTEIPDLCKNTTYEFSAWLLNLLPASKCSGNGIPINVKFQIWDITDTKLLAEGDTNNIYGTNTPNWQQFGLVFTTVLGQNAIILKMINNSSGGCGNDVAIDDIVFKSCGDKITIEDTSNQTSLLNCEIETPISVGTLTATPQTGVTSSHFYQWEMSYDEVTWMDIPGETNDTYTPSVVTQTTHYRAKVSEDLNNVNISTCNSLTDVFTAKIIPTPNNPLSNGDVVSCDSDKIPISVTIPTGETVNWYNAAVGGTLIKASSTTFAPTVAGTYFAEAVSSIGGCISINRTAITYTISYNPVVFDETLLLCNSENIILDATMEDVDYLWSTGETTSTIIINTPGKYTVTVSNTEGCSSVKTFTVQQILTPEIESVTSKGSSILVKTTKPGDFEYALNNQGYQTSNVFERIAGGYYTVYVRERNGCGEAIQESYLHFVIPLFFTPNGDGFHDQFNLVGIDSYGTSEVSIFNRYGKLLVYSKNAPFSWDGTYNNKLLPTSDYWYVITIDSQVFTGHFTIQY